MKRILKRFLVAALVLTMILSGTLTAFGANANGVKVQYNGKEINLTGASAKMIDGNVMVPFRQILETMGADVTYDSKTKTILAKTAERELSFAVGGTDITITENGTQTVKKMDVAPFVDKNSSSIYAPVRFIAESMGYGVGWDAAEKTVVIIDPSTLFANADEDFSIISQLMKSDLDLEKAYATTGKFDMSIETYADPESIMPAMDFSVAGKISGIQQKSNADLVMNLVFNFDKMMSDLKTEEKSMIEPMLRMFKDANMKIKMDGESGVTYMNSSLFSTLTGEADSNTWYKMNVYDTYEDMGIDMKSMANMSYSDMDISEMLDASVATMQYADTATYQDMKTTYAVMKYLIGNQAFQTRTTGGISTHILNISQTSVLAAITRAALAEGLSKDTFDLTETGDLLNSMDVSANIIIRDKGGILENYDLKGSYFVEDISGSFDLSGNQKKAECQMKIDMKDVMKMDIQVETRISETSEAPDLSLPENAKVVDYPTYLQQLESGNYN